MEPRYSMSAYAIVMVVVLVAVGALDHQSLAIAMSAVTAFIGLFLAASYRVRTRHFRGRVLNHRRQLDRLVLAQWLAQLAIVVGGSVSFRIGGVGWGSSPTELTALILGAAFAVAAIYVSSLVDWYWVLPKISGLTGPLPCAFVGGERFAGVTKVWLFHRATATAIVTAVIAGVPGYLAGQEHVGGASAFWVIVGAGAAIGFNSVAGDVPLAFKYAFNPPFNVGRLIQVRDDPRDAELEDAYVVDMSIHGAKYKLVRQVEAFETPAFSDKGRVLPLPELDEAPASDRSVPVCPNAEGCRAINWYCFRNPLAHKLASGAEADPPPLDFASSDSESSAKNRCGHESG